MNLTYRGKALPFIPDLAVTLGQENTYAAIDMRSQTQSQKLLSRPTTLITHFCQRINYFGNCHNIYFLLPYRATEMIEGIEV